MSTIKEKIEKAIIYNGTKLLTFEATHDNDICAYVDFIYPVTDKFAVGFSIIRDKKAPSVLMQTALNVFKKKFGGICYVISVDDNNKIVNPETLRKVCRDIADVRVENSNLNLLVKMGLTENESIVFYNQLRELKPIKENVTAFYKEMEEGVPFEGGMGFGEALTGLLLSINPDADGGNDEDDEF